MFTHETFFIPNHLVHWTSRFLGSKGGTAIAVTGITHNPVDLPPLVLTEATGVCIPLANSEVLLAAVYKPLGRARSDTDTLDLSLYWQVILFGTVRFETLQVKNS
jgi:hypothetical protein